MLRDSASSRTLKSESGRFEVSSVWLTDIGRKIIRLEAKVSYRVLVMANESDENLASRVVQ